MKFTSYTASGSKSTKTVDEAVFGTPVNKQLLSQAIRVYLSNQRQGTSAVKTRADVVRTKAKWFRQKGTGNARHGARSAPLFVGGGVAHGPSPKNWTLKLTPILKKKALMSALSAQAENIVVAAGFDKLDGKTKSGATLINSIEPATKKILVVIDKTTPELLRSLRNLEKVLITRAQRLNALEVAMADVIVFTPQALEAVEARLTVSKPKASAKKVAEKPAKKTVNKKTDNKTTKSESK